MDSIRRFIWDTKNAYSAESLCQGLRLNLRDLGFDVFIYFGTDNGGKLLSTEATPIFLTNLPHGWARRYLRSNYHLSDPIVIKGKRCRLPFFWGRREMMDSRRAGQRFLLNEVHEFGVEHGLMIPIHGPGVELGLLSVSSNSSEEAFQEAVSEQRYTLQLIGLYTHAMATERLANSTDSNPVVLTSREKEVLLWAARGKTNWEISRLIQRSEATVNFHIQRAMRKLKASNRCQAAVRAAQFNLIGL